MKPYKVVISVLLLAPALAILALGPRGKGDKHAADAVVVDYWESWNGDELAQLKEIIDDFNNGPGKEKKIFVRVLSVSGIIQKVLVATAAGVPPDIAGLWDNNVPQYAALDALEPLEGMAAEHGITRATYKDVYWDACYFDGHLNALVCTPYAAALHYNKKTLEENAGVLRAAGLDPSRPPESIGELDRFSEALTVRDDKGHITRAGFLPMEPDWFRSNLPLWFGGDYWDEKTKRFTFTSPPVIAAYEWVASYSKRYGQDAINEFHLGAGQFDTPQNPFLTGQVVLEQQGPWMANYIGHLKPSMSTVGGIELYSDADKAMAERLPHYEWGVAPFPASDPKQKLVAICPSDVVVIPKGAKHKREAFEFIAYLQTQPVMEKLCRLHCKNSPLRVVSDDFLNHHRNPYIRAFEDLASSPNAHHSPICPLLAEASAEMDAAIQSVALLTATPREAMEKCQARMSAKLEEFNARQAARRAAEGGQR